MKKEGWSKGVVVLYDIMGNEVIHSKIGVERTLSIDGLKSGIYVVAVYDGGQDIIHQDRLLILK